MTERRRLRTTPCIFGNTDLRTALTNFSRGGVVGLVLVGLSGLLSEREEEVMRLGGKISLNVDFCLWCDLLDVGIDGDSDFGVMSQVGL